MNPDELLSRIKVDLNVCFGKPCIHGHRIWVSLMLDFLMEKQCKTLFPTGISNYPKTTMNLHYYPETDSLYIDLNSKPSADSREITDGLVLDFDASGNVVGIDIDRASEKLDLKTLETTSLPATATKIARGATSTPKYGSNLRF
jgi:uncharacterized protein YuzE